MSVEFYISIFLDIRRKKKNGKYPIKLRVFTPQPRIQKLYPTIFEYTEAEFKSFWESKKPRREFKEDRSKLKELEEKANRVAKKLSRFTFEAFEKSMFSLDSNNYTKDVVYYYEQAIAEYKRNKQIGTASNYEGSLNSLLNFHGTDSLSFYSITPQWLKNYETDMVKLKGRSLTTVGIYLRPLRSIFNTAISENIISIDDYPFGKRKYSIPSQKGVKKALSKEQLKKLFHANPNTPEQEKAKDFWFFSYSCNGMNFKDIANLQYKNISGETLTFRRAKTQNTNKNQAPVIVYLNDFALSVIDKYGIKPANPENYIFDIIDHSESPDEQHRKLKNYIRYINQHFVKFAKYNEVNEKVSTYWARHSFATISIRNGASMEYVQEALSHSDIKTTIGYFAGFEDEKKKEISKKNMEF